METPELRTDTIKDRGTPHTPAIAQAEQSQKDIAEKNKEVQTEIKGKEFRSEIQDFLNQSDSDSLIVAQDKFAQAERVLFNRYFPFFQSMDSFSLMDLPIKEITGVLKAGITNVESDSDRKSELNQVDHAEQMQALVDQLKSEGLSNTAIITRVLSESESGKLTVPSEKLEEYRNYLALLNSSDIPQSDKAELTEILNRPGFDITADDSFEQFRKEILKSRTISESTKEILITQFKVKPIVTGNDLKTELVARTKFIAQRKREITELTDSLKSVTADLEDYQTEQDEIQDKLENPDLTDSERRELEQEATEIEDAIKLLEEQAQEMKDSKRILKASTPNNSIVLGNATASYKDELIRVQLPDNRNYLNLPIQMSPEDITRSVNAFLVYEEFEKRGLVDIVFPDEKLQDGIDLPSNSMMTFTNEILRAIGMSKEDEILKLDNLEEFNRYLDCFSSDEAKGNVELESAQFKTLTTNENGEFSKRQLFRQLKFLCANRSNELFSCLDFP